MADVNANIGVNIDASDALAQLKQLQRQISQFHSSIQKSSEQAAIAQRNLTKNFMNSVNAINGFSAELKTVRTTAESFTNSLEKNKFSLREYFRYAGASTKSFGRMFTSEFNTIEKVAIERVKTLQTQYIKLGRDASGAMQSIAIRPTILDMQDLGTQAQIAAQKQALFNQLLKQGSTNLLNFGKNTQWAGRQLMVGFTLPLATLGTVASKTFMEMEAQVIKFKKVYGDLFTPTEEREQALKEIQALASSFTQYGVAASETVGLAADAAAAGFSGLDLQRQVTAATRLSVLGQVDNQKALETTIALQNAFKISSDELADSINFLNAVENQTVVALDDVTTAIPKVAPVIQSLGGDVKDLAFFLAAMKEGGINASEGANALKSGLAALINPTDKAAAMLGEMGINIRGIVERNAGNLSGLMTEFALSLDRLDPLQRSRAIEQLFGKFQFARISTLFENIIRDGNQASRVLDLSSSSVEELASLAEQELGVTAESSMNKFLSAVEQLRIALAPIGEIFLNVVTPIVDQIAKIADGFNKLPDGVKKAITVLVTVVGGIGPVVLMTFGLLANAFANAIKFVALLRNGYLRLTGQSQILGNSTDYLTQEQLEAAAVAASLDQAHAKLTQRFTAEAVAVEALRQAYLKALAAGNQFAKMNPGMMKPGSPKKFASGGIVGGSGNKDTVPAMLTPGEFVVNKEAAMKVLPFLQALNNGSLPGFNRGGLVGLDQLVKGFSNATIYLPESMNTAMGSASGRGVAAGSVASQIRAGGTAGMAPLMAAIAQQLGMSINSPEFKSEWIKIGDQFADVAATAIENSGREFIKDLDLEEIVVPALKDAAKDINVGGKEISTALDKTFTQIRTAGAVGTQSGSKGATGRINLGGSYKGLAGQAQRFALSTGNETFARNVVPSTSRGTKNLFQMKNIETGQFETATMAHVMRSVTTTVKQLQARVKSYLGDVGSKIVKAATGGVVDGVKEAAQSNSPSKKAKKAGKDIADGAIQGIKEGAKGARKAGQDVGSQSARYRDPATGRFAKQPSAAAAPIVEAGRGFENLNSKLMGLTFGISAISGAMSMFGGNVGNVAGIIMQVSSVMFGLITVTELLAKTKLAEIASSRAAAVGGLPILTKGKGLAGLFGNLAKGLGFVLRFLGPVGIGISLLAAGIPFLVKIMNDQKAKIEGLGKAANFSADELNNLATLLGQTNIRTTSFGGGIGSGGVSAEGQRGARSLLEGENLEQFEKDYADKIAAIRNTTKEQAEQTLAALATQLSASGFEVKAVEAIISAIAQLAGRTDLNLKFASIDFATDQTQIDNLAKTSASNLNAALAKYPVRIAFSRASSLSGVGSEIIPPELQTQINAAAGEFTSLFQATKLGFEGGTLSAEQMIGKLNEIQSNLMAIDPSILDDVMKAVGENLDLDERIQDLDNVQDKLLMIKAIVAGVEIDPKMLDVLSATEKSSEVLRAQRMVRDRLTKSINEGTVAQEKQNEVNAQLEEYDQILADANASIGEQIKAIEDSNTAYDTLIANKFTEEEATRLASDAHIAAALAHAVEQDAIRGTNTAVAEYLNNINALLEAQGKARVQPGGAGGGGGGRKSDFAQAKENLIEQRKEAQNTMMAYAKLRDAGLSVADAFDAAKDPALAAAFATTKPGTKQWRELLGLLKETREQAKQLEKLELAIKVQTDFSGFLDDMLSKANEYFDILERQVDRRYRDRMRKEQKAIEQAEKEITDLQRRIEKEERAIELDFTRPIEALQEESSDLSNDLALIDNAAKKINEKFDSQIKALQEVKRINQDITNQQKTQISLADALSQGDISQAAALMQTMRGQAADASAASMEDALNAARQGQLAGLTGASGMTRDQIEQRQFEISQQIYDLEEKREAKQQAIRVLQDQVYEIEKGRLQNAKDRLEQLERQVEKEKESIQKLRDKWDDARLAQDLANIKAGEYNDVLKIGKLLVGDIIKNWNSIKDRVAKLYIEQVLLPVGAKAPSSARSSTTTTTTTTTRPTASQIRSSGATSGEANRFANLVRRPMMYGGKVKKMARGGFVGGTGMGDVVPTLLTPGEFVVNKHAAKRFMPMLKRINDTKFPGMIGGAEFATPTFNMTGGYNAMSNVQNRQDSTEIVTAPVYNYNLSVSVNGGKDINANQIANVVMTKIKQMDSQRIRRQNING